MIPQGAEPPKRADFVHWTEHIAAAVTPASPTLRTYLKKAAANAWTLASWLT
jgi:hypothetical protein